jgi:hypothetical protein
LCFIKEDFHSFIINKINFKLESTIWKFNNWVNINIYLLTFAIKIYLWFFLYFMVFIFSSLFTN